MSNPVPLNPTGIIILETADQCKHGLIRINSRLTDEWQLIEPKHEITHMCITSRFTTQIRSTTSYTVIEPVLKRAQWLLPALFVQTEKIFKRMRSKHWCQVYC